MKKIIIKRNTPFYKKSMKTNVGCLRRKTLLVGTVSQTITTLSIF